MAHPYKDPARSISERVKDLLSRMTFEEKKAQLHALWLILSEDGRHRPRQDDFTGGTDPEVVKKTLRNGLGQISRPLGSHGVDPCRGVRALNSLQKFLREETRLGIPALAHEECLVGLMARGATLFPSALAYSATWNPDLIQRAAQAIGREARSTGCHRAASAGNRRACPRGGAASGRNPGKPGRVATRCARESAHRRDRPHRGRPTRAAVRFNCGSPYATPGPAPGLPCRSCTCGTCLLR
jgi:hypothetical protein